MSAPNKIRLSVLILTCLACSLTAISQTVIHYGETITATLSVPGETDSYSFTGTAGDKIVIRMTESTEGSSESMEPNVELLSPGGSSIAKVHNTSQVCISLELSQSGQFIILASDNYPGDDIGNYAIFIQRTFDPGLADTLSYGETVTANLSSYGNIDTYTFQGKAGDKVIIRMTESTEGSSESMEPFVELFNPAGDSVTAKWDNAQVNIEYELLSSGYFTILASDYYPGEDAGTYSVYLFGFKAPGNETDIISFSFGMPPQTGPANINSVSHSINIEVQNNASLTNLVATFVLSDGASATVNGVTQVSGVTVNNFTTPITYRIVAEDGLTTQNWTISVTLATGIEDFVTAHGLMIYPNPAAAQTKICFSNSGRKAYELSIFNISGQKVYEKKNITTDAIDVDSGIFPAGIYFVELKGERTLRGKIIVK